MTGAKVYWIRSFAVMAMLLSMTIAALGNPGGVAAQTTGQSDESGVDGNSYTSPEFQYRFEWDSSWEVADEFVEDGYNLLQLSDDGSILYFEGYAQTLDPEECLDTLGTPLVEDIDGVSEFETTPPDADDGVVSTEITFTFTFEDDAGDEQVIEMAGFISCQAVNDGDAVLVITHLGNIVSWDDENDARADILDTLTFDGEPVVADPGDDESPVDSGNVPGDNGDFGDLLSAPQGDGEMPGNGEELLANFEGAVRDINEFWAREYPLISGGQEYTPPTEFIPFNGAIDTPCGTANSFDSSTGLGNGPFYCPPNQTIYIDMGFANFQMDMVGQVPFLIPVVLAHEVGHHVQDILGMEVCYETPCLDPNVLTSQEIEYMADCYAGSWSRDAELRGRLGERDIDANIVQYAMILGGGVESADPGGHGRGAERVWWFLNGYLEGSARCFETSAVTKDWAQTGPPNANIEDPTEEATEESGDPTEESNNSGDLAAIGDVIETSKGTIKVISTQTDTAVENREAEGEYLIVLVETFLPDGEDGPFDYEAWTVVDADGNVYEIDSRATDIMMETAFEEGTDEILEGGAGYTLAIIFDVPDDASGFVLTNESEEVQIELDR